MKNNEKTQPALKDVFKDDFYIGAALSLQQISGNEPDSAALVEKHFNSITPENILKWEEVHPEPDKYNFEPAGRFVTLGEKNKMHIVGHTLVWFYQTPDWVFQDESGKDFLFPVNNDPGKEHETTLRLKGVTAAKRMYKKSGKWIPLTVTSEGERGVVKLTLAPGDGELLKIERK